MNQSVVEKPVLLSVAIVVYKTPQAILQRCLDSLAAAVCYYLQQYPGNRFKLQIVDNSSGHNCMDYVQDWLLHNGSIFSSGSKIILLGSNVGYGMGHNHCLSENDSEYHLILNPDVFLEMDALVMGLHFMARHPHVGMVSPYAENDMGQPLYLCKRYPAVFDLLLRGFAPGFIRKHFDARLARYEMRAEYLGQEPCMDVEIISGCCMLARTEMLRQVGGFSEAYFLYFEDFDLSLQMRNRARLAYVPQMKIIHEGGQAARKGLWHVFQFVRSGITFFNRNGWRWL